MHIEFPGERDFLRFVRNNKEIGYGRMIQIIEEEWNLKDKNQYVGIEAIRRIDPIFDEGKTLPTPE